MSMRRLLLFFFLLIIIAWYLKSQQFQNQNPLLTGFWIFEKAEYMEQASSGQNYQAKHTIDHKDNLYAYGNCFQEIATRFDLNGDYAKIETLFASYIGKESPVPDMKDNAPDIQYLVDIINENTISATIEKLCNEDGVQTIKAGSIVRILPMEFFACNERLFLPELH